MSGKKQKTISFERSRKNHRFTSKDWVILIAITVIYSAIALFNLGDMDAPDTKWTASDSQNIIFDLGEVKDIESVNYYMGEYANFDMALSGRDSSSDMWDSYKTHKVNSVFSWGAFKPESSCRYLMISLSSPKASLFEVVIKDSDGNTVTRKCG